MDNLELSPPLVTGYRDPSTGLIEMDLFYTVRLLFGRDGHHVVPSSEAISVL